MGQRGPVPLVGYVTPSHIGCGHPSSSSLRMCGCSETRDDAAKFADIEDVELAADIAISKGWTLTPTQAGLGGWTLTPTEDQSCFVDPGIYARKNTDMCACMRA